MGDELVDFEPQLCNEGVVICFQDCGLKGNRIMNVDHETTILTSAGISTEGVI